MLLITVQLSSFALKKFQNVCRFWYVNYKIEKSPKAIIEIISRNVSEIISKKYLSNPKLL